MHSAIVLIGPTGSGKTPLGDTLERRGLWNQRCVHFDFGHELRLVTAAAGSNKLLTRDELRCIREVLRTGALLDDEQFPIARKILLNFLRTRCATDDDIIVLNGLPRHLGQAADIDSILRTVLVIHLACTPDTILERIRTDAGGDRRGRTDDSLTAIRRKLATFERRTRLLIDHYRTRNVTVFEHAVTADDKPHLLWPDINRLSI